MIREKFGCVAYNDIPTIPYSQAGCGKYAAKYRKLVVPAYLAAASCRWELTSIDEERCGIPVGKALQKLGLHSTKVARLYIGVLRTIRDRIALSGLYDEA